MAHAAINKPGRLHPNNLPSNVLVDIRGHIRERGYALISAININILQRKLGFVKFFSETLPESEIGCAFARFRFGARVTADSRQPIADSHSKIVGFLFGCGRGVFVHLLAHPPRGQAWG